MLGSLQNLVIIDEIQQMPELFRVSNANSAKLQKRRDR
jgi:hypothetical protein